MPPPVTDPQQTRRLLAWLGSGLLAGGMPVHEVEEDVREAAIALGHEGIEVAASPTGLWVTLASGEATTFEAVDGGVRLDQLAEVTAVHAALTAGTLPAAEALQRLSVLRQRPHRYPAYGLPVGTFLVAIGIALVLAPAWPSILFAAVISQVVAGLMALSGRTLLVGPLLPFLAAFASSVAAFGLAERGLVDAPLWTLVPPIAVLLPGSLIVTGLTELSAGAMMAGTGRLAYGGTQMLLATLGVGAAVAVLGLPLSLIDGQRPEALGWWAPLIGLLVIAVGISLLESVPPSLVPALLVTVLATFAAQSLGNAASEGPWVGAFLGACAASLTATLVEFVRPQVPRVVAFLPSFWLLVPGSLGLVSVAQLESSPTAGVLAAVEVLVIVASIALGVLVGAGLAHPLRSVVTRLSPTRRAFVRQLARRPVRRSERGPRPD
ncbi:threonine/serine ThrE exporter family protein [Janibacter anophelis]|uniref:threonine/serine ThrE exporter family protein n=1 Tax=Janibacter anophelis TaxID=319054 RepID=UPI0013B065BD|nr:threonine/serine exporter family protein [Janibacter anophelis]